MNVPCPTCGSAAGEPCVSAGPTVFPKPLPRPHKDRVRAERGHKQIHFYRRTLGHHPVNGHTLYGWTARCSCGWEKKVNGSKPEAVSYWRSHADAAITASEAKP